MEKYDIYKDIAKRTNGDIYIGVVGPVRTGKSTFITKFMDIMVAPNISNKSKRQIAIDEMPQSGAGKTIMTTEPKFVPSEGVKISLKNKVQAKVRLIDCVGYLVDGVIGDKEDDKPRLIKTPWDENPMPFEKAASIGTEKVIEDHSTLGVLITCDGSICDIERENYVKAEEKVVDKLKQTKKPFVIVLNCVDEKNEKTLLLADNLSNKYGVKVIPLNVLNADENSLTEVLESVLLEFPLKSFDVKLPKWMQVLPSTSPIIKNVLEVLKNLSTAVEKMKDYKLIEDGITSIDGVKRVEDLAVNLGEGLVEYKVDIDNGLFYTLLSDLASESICDEFDLMSYIKELNVAKENYKKLKEALFEVDENGYGIVIPSESDMDLSEPQVVKRGGRYGVNIKANTSCMHIMKINLDAQVSPISGTQKQCQDFAEFLKNEYEENPEKVWKTDVFGKPLYSLVSDEIVGKIESMKNETKNKMRRTITRIVNEGKGGVICILL